MADITVTATNVLPSTNAVQEVLILGEAAAAGQAVFKKASDGKLWLAQCDAATDDDLFGILLTGGAAGQQAVVQTAGNITIGGTVVVGMVYVLSAAAGGICPLADLAQTNYVTQVGIGISATVIQMHKLTTGVQKP